MNKDTFVEAISNHINACYTSRESKRILYTDLKRWILTEEKFREFLEKKKDPISYIDTILKYDKLLIRSLVSDNEINITRNRKGYFTIEENTVSNCTSSSSDVLETIDTEVENKYYCPYNKTIQETRQAKRNKFKIALTNEPIFNEYLQGLKPISNLVGYLHDKYVTDFYYKGNKIVIYEKQRNVPVCHIKFGDGFVLIEFVCDTLKGMVNELNSLYPFTHFKLTEQIIALYLIHISENKEKSSMIKYLTFNSFEITKNTMIHKYFSKDYKTSEAFNTFYIGKLEPIVYDEQDLIVSFYNHIENIREYQFTSFLVGYYKLFIYVKNKVNRSVKKCAMDFYHNKINSAKE